MRSCKLHLLVITTLLVVLSTQQLQAFQQSAITPPMVGGRLRHISSARSIDRGRRPMSERTNPKNYQKKSINESLSSTRKSGSTQLYMNSPNFQFIMTPIRKASQKFTDRPATYLLIPVVAAFVGWFTNWLAVQMIFYPVKFWGLPIFRRPNVPLGLIG